MVASTRFWLYQTGSLWSSEQRSVEAISLVKKIAISDGQDGGVVTGNRAEVVAQDR